MNKSLAPEVREYFRELGKKRGEALKARYGSDYFKKISAMRKTFGSKPGRLNTVKELSTRFGVSRQRIYQILETHGKMISSKEYETPELWREAVAIDFFNKNTQ